MGQKKSKWIERLFEVWYIETRLVSFDTSAERNQKMMTNLISMG